MTGAAGRGLPGRDRNMCPGEGLLGLSMETGEAIRLGQEVLRLAHHNMLDITHQWVK